MTESIVRNYFHLFSFIFISQFLLLSHKVPLSEEEILSHQMFSDDSVGAKWLIGPGAGVVNVFGRL